MALNPFASTRAPSSCCSVTRPCSPQEVYALLYTSFPKGTLVLGPALILVGSVLRALIWYMVDKNARYWGPDSGPIPKVPGLIVEH